MPSEEKFDSMWNRAWDSESGLKPTWPARSRTPLVRVPICFCATPACVCSSFMSDWNCTAMRTPFAASATPAPARPRVMSFDTPMIRFFAALANSSPAFAPAFAPAGPAPAMPFSTSGLSRDVSARTLTKAVARGMAISRLLRH